MTNKYFFMAGRIYLKHGKPVTMEEWVKDAYHDNDGMNVKEGFTFRILPITIEADTIGEAQNLYDHIYSYMPYHFPLPQE